VRGVPTSFRLKLTLLAAGTSGIVIAALGLVTWGLVSWTGEDRLDHEIKAAAVHFRDVGPALTTARGSAVESFYGDELEKIEFVVRDGKGGTLFQSSSWPQGLEGRLPQVPGAGQRRCPRLHSAWGWGPGAREPQGAKGAGPEPGAGRDRPGPGAGCRGCASGAGCRGHTAPPSHATQAAPASTEAGVTPPASADTLGCICARSAFVTIPLPQSSWRVGVFPDGPLTLFVAVNLGRFEARSRRLGLFLALALAAALAAAGLGAWWLANRALQPLAALTAATQEITAENLERRIPGEGADREFAQLINVFNGMLERLETSYLQATRFSADVSHELKTPLAIMQGEVEIALTQAPEGGPAQRALAAQLEAVQRLNGLVTKLLLLSRADAGTLRPRLSDLDLSACVGDFCEDFSALHPELSFESEIAADVVLPADPSLFPQVVQNLLSNAVKYNRVEGWVRIALAVEGDQAVVRVTNTGPDINAEERERLFDRFYRSDDARSMASGGGLGLSLAREFARAHAGEVVLEAASEPGVHTFRLSVPLLSSEPAPTS
jgi:two-component system heavy metal sensor histidine kinase CusS